MTFQEYRELDALNNSALKLLLQSPLHYWQEYVNPDRVEKETPSLKIGKSLHSALLEEEIIHDAPPKVDRRTKIGKTQYAEWEASLPPNTIILTKDEKRRVDGMIESVKSHPLAFSHLFTPYTQTPETKVEYTLTFDHPKHGYKCKTRLDMLKFDKFENAYIIDIKTTQDASTLGFAKAVANYKYHMQAALYTQAVKANFPDARHVMFYFICVESQSPFTVGLYDLHKSALHQGDREIDKAMDLWQELQEGKMFDEVYYKHYNDNDFRTISLPRWAQDNKYGMEDIPF